jgi:hypothetical protein
MRSTARYDTLGSWIRHREVDRIGRCRMESRDHDQRHRPGPAPFAWLLTAFVSGALAARSHRSGAAVARHLRTCLTAGWLGRIGLAWGATSLDTAPGAAVFLVGGPLGGLSVWSRSSGDDGPGDDPPPDDDGDLPEWDWERFEDDLADYEASLSTRSPRMTEFPDHRCD